MRQSIAPISGVRAPLPYELSGSLRELNRRFLDLTGRVARNSAARRAAALSAAQRAAAANCPYALFDLRFADERHWELQLQPALAWRVAEDPAADAAAVEFVRRALFYAWQVAATAPLCAPLLLGLSARSASAFTHATVDRLADLAPAEALHLNARWPHCEAYWSALTKAAAESRDTELRRVQLFGIQLVAAVRLCPSGAP